MVERWELDNNSISMLDIPTQSIIRKERSNAQQKLMEYLWGVCDKHAPPIQFINYRPQIYRWGCKKCQKELTHWFEINFKDGNNEL